MAEEQEEQEQAPLDLDEIVRLLEDEHGIHAYVEQTGGGTATVYAGEAVNDSQGDPRYPVVAGPGWFDGPGFTLGRADASDFYIGPDDGGENPEAAVGFDTALTGWTETDVANEIARQMTH